MSVKKIKRQTLKDKELREYVEDELNGFSEQILVAIEKAVGISQMIPVEPQEKEKSKLYVGKLIEYIGNCGRHSGRAGTIKYLLMSFIEVLDMAGRNEIAPKGRYKAKKRVLVFYILFAACNNNFLLAHIGQLEAD